MNEENGMNRFLHGLVGLSVFAYGCYWMYLCCHEHWRRSVGPQNLILLLFNLSLVFLSLFFFTKNKKTPYLMTAFISFIPGVIVCFINRATRYPDFVRLIEAYNLGSSDDAITLSYQQIYSEPFLQYDYIVSRSSDSSLILAILQFIWFILLLHKIFYKKSAKSQNLSMDQTVTQSLN